jgi:hypothetical protein
MTKHLPVGVVRYEMTIDANGTQTETETGSLILPKDPDEDYIGSCILYTLGLDRLTGMLDAARRGESTDDLILALDAAALDHPDYLDDEPDYDGDGNSGGEQT